AGEAGLIGTEGMCEESSFRGEPELFLGAVLADGGAERAHGAAVLAEGLRQVAGLRQGLRPRVVLVVGGEVGLALHLLDALPQGLRRLGQLLQHGAVELTDLLPVDTRLAGLLGGEAGGARGGGGRRGGAAAPPGRPRGR